MYEQIFSPAPTTQRKRRKLDVCDFLTLNFGFYANYASVSYTETPYHIQSNRVEDASKYVMPLYQILSNFVLRAIN